MMAPGRTTATSPTSPGALPRRDRIAILAALGATSALAWAWMVHMARDPCGMAMGSDPLAVHPWSAADFALVFAMWVVMMVGMMVPTAAPATLLYAAVARKGARQGTPLAPTAVFVAGYAAAWALFGALATLAQWGLDRAALLSPMWVTTSPAVGAALLVVAGVHQLTPWKDTCLRHCRAPAHFFAARWRPGAGGAFRMGLVHGAFCLGCCWALMGLLFVAGVMSLFWIAAIAFFALAEKVLPFGRAGGRLAAIPLIGLGLFYLAAALGVGVRS
jgi:predicted metal-binding membrane protein